MANASKKKGTAHETAMVHVLRLYGYEATRTPAGQPSHDIAANGSLSGIAIECKNHKTWQIMAWADKACQHHGEQWMLLARADGRKHEWSTLAILPIDTLLDLLRAQTIGNPGARPDWDEPLPFDPAPTGEPF